MLFRILLQRKFGAISHEEIRTVGGIICDSFHQAYRMRGLLEEDQQWHDTINEATLTKDQVSYECYSP